LHYWRFDANLLFCKGIAIWEIIGIKELTGILVYRFR